MVLKQSSTSRRPSGGSSSRSTSRTLGVPSASHISSASATGSVRGRDKPSTASAKATNTKDPTEAGRNVPKRSKKPLDSTAKSRLGKSADSSKNANVFLPAGQKMAQLNGSITSSSAKPQPPVLKPLDQSDTLQVAAQLYSWLYMNNSLKKAHDFSNAAAREAIESFRRRLQEEESDISDRHIRFEAERLIAFLEELASSEIAADVAWVIRGLMKHEEETTPLLAEALTLAGHGVRNIDYVSPMHRLNDLLSDLARLRTKSTTLETALHRILSRHHREESYLKPVLQAYLPVLHARADNLDTATELILDIKENIGMWLERESLVLDTGGT
ncbi:hypothetical protein GLOTRDRAFT_125358 [Gloeophyllum trabeum ATCC 11539]|uniref:Uncharacterized protein n=1 Tax=Gloeophyllum trabeum (strain ATCC 11539 / FP-39264 / Madison 617) TaxID=670483 RepID=S7QIH6_GLOTA|nr:uncharacterized protein GLOTRDRAFT_125358 [Gloeophyllum trabeum ATCC 11539]EPQ59042.1 hypothetical protein GLOTRDRAFT_125358 [Gloeophyllum trabeum ATCC 11539]